LDELAGQEYAGMEAKIERMEQVEQANWLAYEKEAQERARAAEAARWAGMAAMEEAKARGAGQAVLDAAFLTGTGIPTHTKTPAILPVEGPTPTAPNTVHNYSQAQRTDKSSSTPPRTFLGEVQALFSLKNLNDPVDEMKKNIPGTTYSILTDDKAITIMKKAEGLPPIKIALPVLRGFGIEKILPSSYMVPPTLVKTFSSDAMVRTLGRTLGGIDNIPLGGPISFVAGLGVSVAPNYKKNIDSGRRGRAFWEIC
jgi:hypothetical protein